MGRSLSFVVFGFLCVSCILLFVRGNEDTWLCARGSWVKHGNPNTPKPTGDCIAGRPIQFSSPSIPNGADIPVRYTCDGQAVVPPFVIGSPSPGVLSYALSIDDLTAPGGVFHHLFVWNIPKDTRTIEENTMPISARFGNNSSGQAGYQPICPHAGTHTYQFTMYALRKDLPLKEGAQWSEFDRAVSLYSIATASFSASYTRANDALLQE